MGSARLGVVGRDQLVIDLVGRLRRPGAVLTLTGEAGIGKTTVLTEVLTRVESDWLWSAQCLEIESELGLAVLGDLYGTVPASVLELLPAPQRRAIDVVLYRDEAADSGWIDDRLLGATTLSVLTQLGRSGRVLIGIDDIQWCDPTSFAALNYAVRRLVDVPVSVLTSSRTGAEREFSGAAQLVIPPLDADSVVELVRAAADGAVSERDLAQVVAMSGGNPFFARELARHMAECRTGRRLPTSLRVALEQRLGVVGAATRTALLDVAVRGAHAADASDIGDLDEAIHAGIVAADNARIQFTHPLLASAVLESASRSAVREAHRRAALTSTDSVARALHRARSSSPNPEVSSELDAAVEVVLRRGDLHGARDLARLAFSLGPTDADTSVHRLVTLAERSAEVQDLPEARVLAEQVVARSSDSRLTARALLVLAATGTDPNGAYKLVQQATELPDLPREQRVLLESAKALLLAQADRLLEAREVLDCAMQDMRPDDPGWSHLVGLNTVIHRFTGRPPNLDDLRRAVELERNSISGARMAPLSRTNAGSAVAASAVLACYDDRHDDAAALLVEAINIASAHGHTSMADQYPAVLAWRIGDLTKTASELQQLLIQRDESRQPILLCRLALVDAYRGDPEAARNKIIKAASQPQPPGIRSEVQFVAGCLALLEGDAERAWTVLSKVAADLEASGYREPSHPPILPAAIEAATAVGDLLAAEQLCTRLEADSAALHSRFGAAAARRARGLIAQARGDTPTAEACLAGAAEAFDDLGVRLEAAHCYHKLGALLRRHGQRRRARNAFETAQEIYDDCGAYGLTNLATEELARIPGRAAAHTSELTESERRVAELVSNGMANKDVAHTLHVSVKTVETHLTRVFRKLGAANRTDLARRLAAPDAHPIGLP